MFRYFSILFGLILITCASPASAELSHDDIRNMTPRERVNLENEILKDYKYTEQDYEVMVSYFHSCHRLGTSRYHDCECMAKRYIEKRVVYDTLLSDFEIIQEISRECIDEVSVAGLSFLECRSLGRYDKRWSEEFCECYANYYAETYKVFGGDLSFRQSRKLRLDSLKACNYYNYNPENTNKRRRLRDTLSSEAQRRLEQ